MLNPQYRKCNGFTLIEIIITMAILSIVATAIFSLFLYNTNVFQSSTAQSNAQSDARIAIDYITRETKYATDLTIISVATSKIEILNKTLYNNKHYNYIYVDNGVINQVIYNNTTSQYTTKSILNSLSSNGTSFTKTDNSTLGIKIVGKDGTKTFTIASNIVLINFAISTPTPTLQVGPDLAIRYIAPITQNALVSSIIVSSSSNSITTANGTMQMITAILPGYATNQNVTWSVNDGSFATITSTGLLTARKTGNVTVIATASDGSGKNGTKIITLTNQPVLVSSITLNGASGRTGITTNNGILQMSASILPFNAANQTYKWSVSDSDIATIDSSGKLTALGNGTVTVIAIANDTSGAVGTLDITLSNQVPDATTLITGSISGTNTASKFSMIFNKSIQSVEITINNTGKTITSTINNQIITLNFSSNVSNNKGLTLKVTGNDGTQVTYKVLYKNNGAWRKN
jgi:prepilin-type N-terminal cleavage/methylation domain-containing protein